MPDRRSTWFWIMSKPAAVVGRPARAIQSTRAPIIPPRRDGSGRGPGGGARRAGCHVLPWCAGTSGMSVRAGGRRRPGRSRRPGAAPGTPGPSWCGRFIPRAGRRGTRVVPVRAARRQRGYRGGLSRPARCVTADSKAPRKPHPSVSGRDRQWAYRAGPQACRAPPPRSAKWAHRPR